jgi:FkbM family methyltransferase
MISFAQNFEDVMLWRIFRDQPNGFYVDVGAADPVRNSVTKWFYDLGWSGINIEPHPEFFKALQLQRARDTNLNCGVGAAKGEASFAELPLREWSSFDGNARSEAVARGETIVERITPILSLNDIFEHHGGGRTIDFLKIDVEGWERQVLSGLDLLRHRPTVLLIEATHQGSPEPNSADWEQILTVANYCPIYFDGLNKFYVPRDKIELARHFAVPPNVFDAFTLADVHTLTAMLKTVQAESEIRLEQIHTLTATQERSLEQIHTLTATRERSVEQIHNLSVALENAQSRAASYDRLIATLRMPEAPRALKIGLQLARIFRKLRSIVRRQ